MSYIKSYIFAILASLCLSVAPWVALDAVASTGGTKYPNNPCKRGHAGIGAPPLHCVDPDWVGVVRPGALRHVRLPDVGDVQCYNNRTGKSYNQGFDRGPTWNYIAGRLAPFWYNNAGRSVAGFDTINNDFVNFTKRTPVVCAAWRDA